MKERSYRYIRLHVKCVLSDFNPNQNASTNCSRSPKCESSQKSSCLRNCVECGGIDMTKLVDAFLSSVNTPQHRDTLSG
jgi:hypothetical protein